MFDDPKKELKRLQDQLLEDEEWLEEELENARAIINSAPGEADTQVRHGGGNRSEVRNTELEKPRKGIGGLVLLALLEILGILGIIAWWMLVLLK